MLGSRVGIINSQKVMASTPVPTVWIDPSDASTVTLSGSQIIAIASKAGSTSGVICKVPYTSAISGAPTTGPTLNVGTLNGKNTMLFNSVTRNGLQSDTYYQLPNTIVSCFIVYKQVASTVTMTDHVLQSDSANGRTALFSRVGAGNTVSIVSANYGIYEIPNIAINTWRYVYWEAKKVGTTVTCKIYINGVLYTSTVSGTPTPEANTNMLFCIGGPLLQDGSFGVYFMKGEIAEIIEYPDVLTDTDRITVQDYLKAKYNLP